MKTITLYSNNEYDLGMTSGCITPFDARWNSIDSDDSRIMHPREKPASQTLWPHVANTESDWSAYIFNSAGIHCDYSNNKNCNNKNFVRLVDVGSCPNWKEVATAANSFFDGKPHILFTSQEPCTSLDIIRNNFPNTFVMDIGYGEPAFDRHLPYPAFFARFVNPMFNTVIGYHTINLAHKEGKKYIYNNLKFRNDSCKSITQYMLYKHTVLNKGLVTYNRDKGVLSQEMLPPEEDNHIIQAFDSQVMNSNIPGLDISMYSNDDFIDWFRRQNSIGLNPDGGFSAKKRYHPIYVYNESYFSMINESGGSSLCNSVFSEKSLLPILNGHPFTINQQMQGQFYKHLTDLGFELYDEILSYPSPNENRWLLESILNNINNINQFDPDRYFRHLPSIIKKSRHNRANFFNTNSKLWSTLRALMQTHMEKYFDACN